MPVYRSPRLRACGVAHAFTTRGGGVSSGPYAALNLGFSTGDAPADVLANRARLCAALGFAPEALRFVKQVHGDRLVEPADNWPTGADGEPPEADGLLTDDPRWLIGVRGADCLNVLFATPDGRAVAAAHAGWRGLVAGILPAAARALAARAGVPTATLVAAIGPGIGPARYEVGPEVVAAFPSECVHPLPGGTRAVCLAGFAERQLREAGLTELDVAHRCTYDGADEFFSYRRDGATTGRHAAVVGVRGKG